MRQEARIAVFEASCGGVGATGNAAAYSAVDKPDCSDISGVMIDGGRIKMTQELSRTRTPYDAPALILLGEPLIWHLASKRSLFSQFLQRAMPAGVRAFVVTENLGSLEENTNKIVASIRELSSYAPLRNTDRLFIDRSAEVGVFSGARFQIIKEVCEEVAFPLSQVTYVSQNAAMHDQVYQAGATWLFFHHFYATMAKMHSQLNDYGYDDSTNRALLLNSKTRPHRIALLSALLAEPFAGRIEYSWRANPALFEYEAALDQARAVFPSFSDVIDQQGAIESKMLAERAGATQVEALADAARTAFLEVIAETDYEPGIKRVTEKSLKPIAAHRPFIVFGGAGSLKILHSLGFRTFSDIWDESYDTISDAEQRLKAVVQTVRQVMAMDFQDVKRQCKATCADNQARLASGFMRDVEKRFAEDVAVLWRA